MPVWILILPAMLMWLALLLLPWRPWSTRERFVPATEHAEADLTGVTVVIPARNEADVIERTLSALQDQGTGLSVIVVDDQSTDATAEIARTTNLPRLQVIQAPPLPDGWSGKLWALEQGRCSATTRYLLLLDADIRLQPGVIGGLLKQLQSDDLHLVSLMARLRMVSAWEKLLMPAFIYFFKLLYPFALANDPGSRVAAAAGGCILLRSDGLTDAGGFVALRGELIDDCALARHIKQAGGRTWLGLSHAAISERRYDQLAGIWPMVTRTAYAQLHHSPWWLLLCISLLLIAFALPVAGLFLPDYWARMAALTALCAMWLSYLPVLRYYELPLWWAVTLPLAALLFGLMTLDSARRHITGHGAVWKERVYAGTVE